jgi:hypothetical protein
MLLWRATVSPVDNIGEPYLAEWENDFPADPRYIGEIDNSRPQRWMRLSYAMPTGELCGWWFPGHLEEDIYTQNNFGQRDEFPIGYVAHTPLLASHAPLYQQAPPLPHVIPLGRLDDEYVEMLADQTFHRGKKYIRNYVNRYIKTIHPFDDRFTPAVDKRLREDIVNLLIRASNKPWGGVMIYVCDQWDRRIRPAVVEEGAIGMGDSPDEPRLDVEENERYNKLGLDLDLFDDDIASGALYNKKGNPAIPGNKAAFEQFSQYGFDHTDQFERARDAYFPHLKPVEEGRRRKSQRKRYQKELRREGRNPSAIYDGGRRRRTRKHKHTRKHTGKRANRKTRSKK